MRFTTICQFYLSVIFFILQGFGASAWAMFPASAAGASGFSPEDFIVTPVTIVAPVPQPGGVLLPGGMPSAHAVGSPAWEDEQRELREALEGSDDAGLPVDPHYTRLAGGTPSRAAMGRLHKGSEGASRGLRVFRSPALAHSSRVSRPLPRINCATPPPPSTPGSRLSPLGLEDSMIAQRFDADAVVSTAPQSSPDGNLRRWATIAKATAGQRGVGRGLLNSNSPVASDFDSEDKSLNSSPMPTSSPDSRARKWYVRAIQTADERKSISDSSTSIKVTLEGLKRELIKVEDGLAKILFAHTLSRGKVTNSRSTQSSAPQEPDNTEDAFPTWENVSRDSLDSLPESAINYLKNYFRSLPEEPISEHSLLHYYPLPLINLPPWAYLPEETLYDIWMWYLRQLPLILLEEKQIFIDLIVDACAKAGKTYCFYSQSMLEKVLAERKAAQTTADQPEAQIAASSSTTLEVLPSDATHQVAEEEQP